MAARKPAKNTLKKSSSRRFAKSKLPEKGLICKNAECRLRRGGCKGFEGCPGYKG